jgi:hypothetical protein
MAAGMRKIFRASAAAAAYKRLLIVLRRKTPIFAPYSTLMMRQVVSRVVYKFPLFQKMQRLSSLKKIKTI